MTRKFHEMSIEERRQDLAEKANLSESDLDILNGRAGIGGQESDRMIENALGVLGMPFGLCCHVVVNGEERRVPMAIEEPSVLAAASHASKLIAAGGGFTAKCTPPHMVGQIQVLSVPDPRAAEEAIFEARAQLLALANSEHPSLIAVGGGAIDIEVRHLPPMSEEDPCGSMLIVHLIVDVRDAMGANAINSMCERLAPHIARLTEGRVRLRILSNLSDRRRVIVTGRVPFSALDGKGLATGEMLAQGIEEASVFAERDPYRAATHNKGIMNGVDAVLLAFGQDWRAVEAGAHAWAARSGRYTAMATWRVRDGYLEGRLEIPMAVGTVGGVVRVHPTVGVALKIAGISGAADMAMLVGAVGLAQNLGALRALAAEGIQQGHMRLHARNVAVEAGASDEEVDRVAEIIAGMGKVRLEAARQTLAALRAAC